MVFVLTLVMGCGTGLLCGPGTQEQDGMCVPDDQAGDSGDSGDDTGTDSGLGPPSVCSDGSAEFTEIQDAIDAASPGDRIVVCPGTYGGVMVGEGVDVEVVSTGGRDNTTIFGGGSTAVEVDQGALVLRGFSVRGTGTKADGAKGGAFYVHDQGALEASDCRVDESGGYMTVLAYDGDVSIERCEFANNSTSDQGWLFYFTGTGSGNELVFRHNVVRDSSVSRIWTSTVVDASVTNNIFHGLEYSGSLAFHLEEVHGGRQAWHNNVFYDVVAAEGNRGSALHCEAEFSNNIVAHASGGTWQELDADHSLFWEIDSAYSDSKNGNLFADPQFTDASAGEFTLREGYSPAIDAGDDDERFNDADGTRNDMGAYGGPYGDW